MACFSPLDAIWFLSQSFPFPFFSFSFFRGRGVVEGAYVKLPRNDLLEDGFDGMKFCLASICEDNEE